MLGGVVKQHGEGLQSEPRSIEPDSRQLVLQSSSSAPHCMPSEEGAQAFVLTIF